MRFQPSALNNPLAQRFPGQDAVLFPKVHTRLPQSDHSPRFSQDPTQKPKELSAPKESTDAVETTTTTEGADVDQGKKKEDFVLKPKGSFSPYLTTKNMMIVAGVAVAMAVTVSLFRRKD